MYLRFGDGRVFDFELEAVRELLQLLDSHLERVRAYARDPECPDPEGEYESYDYLVGVGFAACQHYLVATASGLHLAKSKALAFGPEHRGGQSLVALINAAANLWKHYDEWELPGNDRYRKHTQSVLDSLAIPEDAPQMVGILASLVLASPPRLCALLPHLEAWRDSLPGSA